MKQPLSIPLQTALADKLINSPQIKNFSLRVHGHSMRPFLKDGEKIRLRKIGANRRPAIGDVAAVRFKNGLLVHRILMIRRRQNRRRYFTKGDRRLIGDGWVKEDGIAGIMIRKNRSQRIIDLTAAGFSALLWCVGKLLRRRRKR